MPNPPDPIAGHLGRLHQVSTTLADLLRAWGPVTDLLDGLWSLALLSGTCVAPHAAPGWRHDARMRLIIDAMIAGLDRGFYKQGLIDLAVPDPQRGRGAPPGTAEQWRLLLRELEDLRTALRPSVSTTLIEDMAMHAPGVQVITTTSRSVGGAGGSQICVQRSLRAITADPVLATALARDLQRQIAPPCHQRALLDEALESCDEVIEALASCHQALLWPRDGRWIGAAAFADWCRAAGVTVAQAESALQDAIDSMVTAQEESVCAEIRAGGTRDHEHHGWSLHFSRESGFTWEAESWNG